MRGSTALDLELWLTSVKCRYLMEEYIPTIYDADMQNESIGELVKHHGKVQRVLMMGRFGNFGGNKKSFVLVLGGREEETGVWAAKGQLSLK